jgi:signal peptidase I
MVKATAILLAGFALAGCGGGEARVTPAQAAEETLEVMGASMEPTLHCARPAVGCKAGRRDEVVVRDEGQVERREIVAFQVGTKARQQCGAGGRFIKRVIAVAGDEVSIRDGAVYLNGRKLREPYANGPTDGAGEYDVPFQHVFVLGDNRAQSCDSRIWGPLAVRRIVGVAYEVQRGSRRIPLP